MARSRRRVNSGAVATVPTPRSSAAATVPGLHAWVAGHQDLAQNAARTAGR